ncbi:hypothetical protein H2199_002689 [Coniosporium tulheliwenetii]|uniref:Uncharacterized protein n=1 Tax=Coniosporium tulheliwenetii TaxID=3383036 RepID=A0ACC2ZH61_9PEZI|nr:hypothetical protein H2199_002689 [Cladosporium sp. JES 115]
MATHRAANSQPAPAPSSAPTTPSGPAVSKKREPSKPHFSRKRAAKAAPEAGKSSTASADAIFWRT